MTMKKAVDSTSGVYKIVNKVNEKSYIGISVNVKYRLKKHKWLLKNNCHFNVYLQNAYNKYGLGNFSFEMIESCPVEELNEKEKYYVDLFRTLTDGYNLKSGGNQNLTLSEETRRKISESNKGKVINQEHREKIRKTLTGFKHSEEAKRNMGNAHKGEKNVNYGGLSPLHVENMSKALTGKKQSKEHVENMMKARFGKFFTLEEKLEMYKLNKEGKMTRVSIAEVYNLNRQTVGKYLKEVEVHLNNIKGE